MVEESLKADQFMFQMMADPGSMAEQLSYLIWGSIVTSARAIKGAKINISIDAQRIFAVVEFHWWARSSRFQKLKEVWLIRARNKSREFVPAGWRLMVYEGKSDADIGDRGSKNQAGTNGDI